MTFDLFIGIDYSGAQTPTSRLKALQVYAVRTGSAPEKQHGTAQRQSGEPAYWTRAEIAHWLIGLAHDGVCYLAGIDHGFSFPLSYFERYRLKTWPQFLDDFARHWPTDYENFKWTSAAKARARRARRMAAAGFEQRKDDEFRLCERWTSSAKSVFQFGVPGAVASSTHAGIPWLKQIRDITGGRVHFWPFDGWQPPEGKAVIAEVYPSIFRNRYPREERTPDEHDAYSVARWLAESAARGVLDRYFDPPLTGEEHEIATREGWILGVG